MQKNNEECNKWEKSERGYHFHQLYDGAPCLFTYFHYSLCIQQAFKKIRKVT